MNLIEQNWLDVAFRFPLEEDLGVLARSYRRHSDEARLELELNGAKGVQIEMNVDPE